MVYDRGMEGFELREWREGAELTQEQLAEWLGVAANTIARWERGERSIPPTVPLALETVGRRLAASKKRKGK